ncbi:hypothetical protein CAP35_06130 [Chitinophagaceae bacterium IBVUCB1]|nr:hypothetical protein CAP35_06130 [Chitinophagaceae bacterium IBVUCB1]
MVREIKTQKMKKVLPLFGIVIVTSFIACRKGQVNTFPDGSSYGNAGLTYQQINGTYKMHDSIYFMGNVGFQPIDPKFRYKLDRNETININVENGVGVFNYQGYKYIETKGVMNEYMTTNPGFTYTKIRFNKDSIYVNFFNINYRNDSALNITVKGYKL